MMSGISREVVQENWPGQALVGRVLERCASGTCKRQYSEDNVWISDSTWKVLAIEKKRGYCMGDSHLQLEILTTSFPANSPNSWCTCARFG